MKELGKIYIFYSDWGVTFLLLDLDSTGLAVHTLGHLNDKKGEKCVD